MLEELVQLHRAGRLDEAEDGYRRLLAENPDNTEALHLLGILRGQCGDLPEAFRLIQRAGELDPENAACRHTLGEMYLSEGRLDEAARAYDQASRLSPGLAAAHSGLGQVALLRGDADSAEEHFRNALGADGNDVQALIGLGAVAKQRGDSQRALQLLTQAAELAPEDPMIQTDFAQALLDQGMLDFAARALDKALAAKPGYPVAQVLRADVHVRKGEAAAALPIYESLLARGEEVAAARVGQGDIARAQGQHDDAIARYGEALLAQPDLHLAAIRRAELLARTSRTTQAIDELRLHVANHPDSTEAHATLAHLLTRAGCSDEALAVWTAAEARWPDDIDLKAQHALALDSIGHVDEALALAEIAADSPRPAVAMLRARHALLTGDPAAAVQRLQHIDRHQLEDEAPQLGRRHQRLLGLAFDALEQWPDAAQAFVSAHGVGTGSLPELPALDAAARAALQHLAAEPEFADARGMAPVFLCGLPGSGVGQVAALLADQPGWFVRRERFEVAPDFVNAPFDANLIQALGQSDLGRLAWRYRQPLQRAGVAETVRVVDWLPVLDARVVPAIKRALPGARLLVVRREPHDMLLDWLGFGWSEDFSMPDPLTGARWLRLAATHLELAASVLPSFRVDPDAAMAAGDQDMRMRLGVFLGLAELKPGPLARGARKGRGGLPVNFPPGHSSHYREVFSEAFATLDG
ncbi:MAG TPA: tetratricopeptide repeat protein [Rhodanobacteraceae bacterium]|nr:tetratricopeptide repeat protein [Rhodanobacteraceae bacterium]